MACARESAGTRVEFTAGPSREGFGNNQVIGQLGELRHGTGSALNIRENGPPSLRTFSATAARDGSVVMEQKNFRGLDQSVRKIIFGDHPVMSWIVEDIAMTRGVDHDDAMVGAPDRIVDDMRRVDSAGRERGTRSGKPLFPKRAT